MRRDEWQLLILLGLAGLGAWLWFTRSGREAAQVVGSQIAIGAQTVASLIRGERNNNPGNIRISTAAWIGKVPNDQNTDGAFEQFREYHGVPGVVWGIRALGKTLLTYQSKYGLRTVEQLINRWAPPSENVTSAYVSAVASALGVAPSAAINVAAPTTLFKLVKAIIRHENGRVAYNDATIQDGVTKALT